VIGMQALESFAPSTAIRAGAGSLAPFHADSVTLRHLRTPAEIEAVLPLRDEIDLSVHLSAGQTFHTLEKKEMKSASWALSRPTESSSAPSDWCRWATA
jgi:hypothetical protein